MQYGRATYGLAAETRNMAVQHNHELVVPNGHDRRIYGPFIRSIYTVHSYGPAAHPHAQRTAVYASHILCSWDCYPPLNPYLTEFAVEGRINSALNRKITRIDVEGRIPSR